MKAKTHCPYYTWGSEICSKQSHTFDGQYDGQDVPCQHLEDCSKCPVYQVLLKTGNDPRAYEYAKRMVEALEGERP